MTRHIIGPFNRVEGDLELRLDIEGGAVARAHVTSPLYRGFEQLMIGRPAADLLAIAPRICGICSVSQSIAAVAALQAVAGVRPAPNGAHAANLAHAAENIADHLTHFYLFFMPDFARVEYVDRPWFEATAARFQAIRGDAAAQALPARARLLEIMGLIAGKWPHSLAFQPGGVTRALDLGAQMRLAGVLADFRAFCEATLFGAPLEYVAELASAEALEAFAETAEGDFSRFLRIARDLRLETLGRLSLPLMSHGAYHAPGGPLFAAGVFEDGATRALPREGVAEDVAFAWMAESAGDPFRAETTPFAAKPQAYSWAKAPRLVGRPVEVGALARQAVDGHALARALLARDGGSSVAARVALRLVEIARLVVACEEWARSMCLDEPFNLPHASAQDGRGAGLVEAARGALGHWIVVNRGLIQRCQIIAPTTWNFSPRDGAGVPGPLEQALEGVEVGAAGPKAAAIQHVVRSFDPCMVCTAH